MDFSSFVGAVAPLIAVYLLPITLNVLGISYLVLRLRPVPPEEQDSQVGLKSGINAILSHGVLMFLIGLTILVADLVVRGDWFLKAGELLTKFDAVHRTAFSVMLSGFIFAFFHLVLLLGYTNHVRHPEVGRVWIGYRFVVASCVVLATVTWLISTIFQDYVLEEMLKFQVAILIVWGPAWLIHLVMLKATRGMGSPPRPARKRRDDDDDDQEKPVRPTPQRPASPGQQQQQQQRTPQQRTGQTGQQQRTPQQRPAPGQVRPGQKPQDDDD